MPTAPTDGLDDMLANLDAIQVFMPGMTPRPFRRRAPGARHGDRPWTAKKENGDTAGAGTNVFDFSPTGRIARVVGFGAASYAEVKGHRWRRTATLCAQRAQCVGDRTHRPGIWRGRSMSAKTFLERAVESS